MDYSLINRYLRGEATEKEIEEIFNWIESSPGNKSEFIKYKQAWALTAKSNKNINASWIKIQQQTTGKKQVRFLLQKAMRYAAIFIVALGLGIILQKLISEKNIHQSLPYLQTTSIHAPYGQTANVSLPDGTSIILNSGSTLFYHSNFAEGERTVKLEGEAFFNVTEDSQHPFTVQTELLDLRVYGTSFNVEAYPQDKQVNTTLIEGSLGVISKKGNELVRLVPSENARYDKLASELHVSKVDTSLYTSWKMGIISFKNETLEDIALKIERVYNVEIIISNKKLANELYKGTILRNKPIDQVLEVLGLAASFEYRIIEKTGQPTLIYWD